MDPLGYTLLEPRRSRTGRGSSKQWMLNLAAGGDNLGGSTYYTFLFVGPNYKGLAQGPDGGTGDGYILPGIPNARFYANAGLSYAFK